MTSSSTGIAGVDLGDAVFAAAVGEDLVKATALLTTELSMGDDSLSAASRQLLHTTTRPLRSLFTVLSAHLGPDPHCWKVTVAAAVTEMVHLAALHHHEVLDAAHLGSRTAGSAGRWHNDVAILAGDYLFATASRLTARLGPDAVGVIAETFAHLVTGQMRELRGPAPGADGFEHYLTVVSERTGSLMGTAGRFGATFSGADDDQIERLSHLGATLGTVLHISQDIRALESDTVSGIDRGDPVGTLAVLITTGATRPGACPLSSTPREDAEHLADAPSMPDVLTAAKDAVARYATHACHEISALPHGPTRDALRTLLDDTLDHHRR